MNSPIYAMLWENWRLTRVEAAWRLVVGLVAGAAALTFIDAGATIAFWILILCHFLPWLSISKLNGGRLMDSYRPGFPFYLLYTHPVPTVVFVGVALGYDAVSCAALYLVSASLLGFAFGQPLPLFSVTVWLVAFHLCYRCRRWSTSNSVFLWVGAIAIVLPLFLLLKYRVASPLQVEFSLLENVLMVLIGVVAFGLTVAGVARQRRGDAVASVPRIAGSGGYPDWLITLFRFSCPTSSATRAQVWFELKSSGLPVLAIGLAFAMLIFLLFAISIPVTFVRPGALGIFFLAPMALFTLGVNAFGIRRKQGRTFASAFEATQPYGTAQLAALKVLVRTACVLAALIAIGVSAWTSSSLVSTWGPWVVNGQALVGAPGLTELRHVIADAIGSMAGYARAALAVVTPIAVAVLVASLATFTALRARYPRQLLVVQWLWIAFGFALLLLTLAMRKGFGPVPLVGEIIKVTFWISGAAMVLATIYLFWGGFAERVLTIRYACGALVISAVFGAAWLAGMPVGYVVERLWLVLGILMVSVLAPWSLSRMRHT